MPAKAPLALGAALGVDVTGGLALGVCASLGWRGGLEQATKLPTISAHAVCHRSCLMLLILLEALAAGCILVLIVWWTMFSGRSEAEKEHERVSQENEQRKL
jgi:nitrogen fixation-related uncharacterized protein